MELRYFTLSLWFKKYHIKLSHSFCIFFYSIYFHLGLEVTTVGLPELVGNRRLRASTWLWLKVEKYRASKESVIFGIIWKNEPEDGNPPLKIGYNSLHEILTILERGLPSSSSFFWVIIQSILKGFVPVMKHLSILKITKHPTEANG